MKRKALLVALILAALVYPVAGAINTINAGDTIFIGEDNLDITAALGSKDKIAYFTGSSAEPEKIATVTSATGFYVSPSEFSYRTGAWYAWGDSSSKATADVAFYVDEPYLKVKVRDTDLDIDVSNKWIPRGDNAGFSIETNLGTMTERGISGAPVTLKVKSPSGTTYSTLADAAGNAQSLTLEVPSSPYDPGISWYTGDSRYSSGTYTVYLESNANNMNDNYPKEGTTISTKVTVLLQSKNPLISPATTEPATTVVTQATTGAATPTTSLPTMATTIPATTTAVPTTVATTEVTMTPPATAMPTTVTGFGTGVAVLAAVSLLFFMRH